MSNFEEVNTTIGYLGSEFQFKLVKLLLEDKQFLNSVYRIVHSRMFTNTHIQHIIGLMLEYVNKNPDLNCSYPEVDILIRNRYNGQDICEQLIETLYAVKELSIENKEIVKNTSKRFFKQQNLTKAIFDVQDLVKQGSSENYDEVETIIRSALELNEEENKSFKVFENWQECLTKDNQVTIPTGYELLDSKLGGGIRKGELGMIIAPTGIGKAQPLYSKVLTPNGFITMGEVKVGTEVIGCDGLAHKVTGVYPQGVRHVFEVRFSDGSSCQCDHEHLWAIEDSGVRKVVSLKEIVSEYNKSHKNIYIPVAKPIDIKNEELIKRRDSIIDTIKSMDLSYDPRTGGYSVTASDKTQREEFFEAIRLSGGIAFNNNVTLGVNRNIVNFSFPHSAPEGFQVLHSEGQKMTTFKKYFVGFDYLGETEVQCIAVDSEEHTYITDDYIVTHNTSSTTGFCAFASSYKHKSNNYEGFKVLQIFFEDLPINIKRKYLGYVTGIESCELHDEALRVEIEETMANDDRVPMINSNIYPLRPLNGVFNTNDLRRVLTRLRSSGFNTDLVIIDYFECLGSVQSKNTNVKKSEWSAEGEKMRQLEAICNEFGVAMWVATQGTKDSIGEAHIGLKHNGGSVQKNQIAHLILALSRTEEQELLGKINIGIPKQRVGRKTASIVNCEFNNGTCRFSDGDALGEIIETNGKNKNSDYEQPKHFEAGAF